MVLQLNLGNTISKPIFPSHCKKNPTNVSDKPISEFVHFFVKKMRPLFQLNHLLFFLLFRPRMKQRNANQPSKHLSLYHVRFMLQKSMMFSVLLSQR